MPFDAIADLERQIEECQQKINELTPFKSSPEIAAAISDFKLRMIGCILALESPHLLPQDRREAERRKP